jgi:alpha-tubulin suppressor-like RCC1 family protein
VWIRLPFVLAVGLPLVALRSPFPDTLQLFLISFVAFGGARGLELLARRTKFPSVIMIATAVVALPLSILVRGKLEAPAQQAVRPPIRVPKGKPERPVAPNEILPGRWAAVSLGESEGAAIAAADGVVHIWNARPTSYEPIERTPAPIAGTAGSSKVSVGFNHSCALRGGVALCWGWNYHGEIGRPSKGTHDRADAPVLAEVPHGVTFIDVSAGTGHTCGVDTDGAVWCWGANQYGECGAKPAPEIKPLRVAELPASVAVRAGFHATCALTADHRVMCWGDREFGGNGSSTTVFGETPQVVTGDMQVVDFDLGQKGGCAIDAAGDVTCWGSGASPARLHVDGGVDIAGGDYHHCVARRDGGVVCWGRNWYGQLGDGSRRDSSQPVVVRGVSGVRALAAGMNDACAIDGEGVLVCWGRFDHGRL